jgi:protein required for attachment to host cells
MQKTSKKIWVLITNGEEAYFFTRSTREKRIPLPQGKTRIDNKAERILVPLNSENMYLNRTHTDSANKFSGRVFESFGSARHKVEPRMSVHDYEEQDFLKNVANHINHAEQEGRFDQLVLVAPSRALGVLRHQLSDKVEHKIRATVKKELAHLVSVSITDIEDYLQDIL